MGTVDRVCHACSFHACCTRESDTEPPPSSGGEHGAGAWSYFDPTPFCIIARTRVVPWSRCVRVKGGRRPRPGRACSAGRTPVVRYDQGQRTGPVVPTSLSGMGIFWEAPDFLLETGSSVQRVCQFRHTPLSVVGLEPTVPGALPTELSTVRWSRIRTCDIQRRGTERPCGGIPRAKPACRRQGAAAPWGLYTLIWSDTCGLSSCLPFRTRCFVLKAQYVKNVFVPGEGLEPSYSSLWARRDHHFRQPGVALDPGIPALRSGVGPDRSSSLCRDPLRVSGALKAANPVVSDRVRERSCVCSSLSYPVPYWAGFHIETLEALVHLLMLAHEGCYPSLDVVGASHSLLIGVDHDRPVLKCEAPAFARGFHGDQCYRCIMKARASGRGRAVRCLWCAASAFQGSRRRVRCDGCFCLRIIFRGLDRMK